MTFSRIFTLKSLMCFFAIFAVLWFSSENLYSQGTANPYPQGTGTSPATQQGTGTAQQGTGTAQQGTGTGNSAATTQQGTQTGTGAGTGTGNLQPGANKVKTPAQHEMEIPYDNFKRPSLISQALVLSLMAMLPFIVMILTSFLKIVIVLSLLRSALGVQQAPPNQIINGVAFMLSLFIMYPTFTKMYDAAQDTINKTRAPDSVVSPESSAYIIEIANQTKEPLREFLKKNSAVKHRALFYQIAYKVMPPEHRDDLTPDDFMIVVPSFITSQLKDAFEIGVLIYIPFFVIDLVTSNILLAMGMMMLSPVTISMPLKLFLLVMLDGWTLLIEGLVNTFR